MGFQVGDKVVDVTKGEGIVDNVEEHQSYYPVSVEFDNNEDGENYTHEGKLYDSDMYPSLYHADGYQPPVGGKEPIRVPPVGTKVWVWDTIKENASIKFFFNINDNGDIMVKHNLSSDFKIPWKHMQLYKVGQTQPE